MTDEHPAGAEPMPARAATRGGRMIDRPSVQWTNSRPTAGMTQGQARAGPGRDLCTAMTRLRIAKWCPGVEGSNA